MPSRKTKILIVVKTYPNPSRKYIETVCVAGVTIDSPPSWIRLYPVLFRDLPLDQQFTKFEIIEAEIKKSRDDYRPESFKMNTDSLTNIGKVDESFNWRRRKELLLPLMDESMCQIQREQKNSQKSLGIFKPQRIDDLIIEETTPEWSQGDIERLSQQRLFGKNHPPLEKIPYQFKFSYLCDDQDCTGHNQNFIDWEIMQLYRNLKSRFPKSEIPDKIRAKYINEVCGNNRDTYFIVGNQMKGPVSFMVLSVFWPPKDLQQELPFS